MKRRIYLRMRPEGFRAQIEGLGGYNPSRMGEEIAT